MSAPSLARDGAQWWGLPMGGAAVRDFQAATRAGSYADYNVWLTDLQGNLLGCATVGAPVPHPSHGLTILSDSSGPQMSSVRSPEFGNRDDSV